MIRLILLVLIALFVVVGGLAVALFHFFGWKGLIAFPFILVFLLWLAKVVIKNLVKRFAMGIFGMKSGVLRGATMQVHSIKSVPKPEPVTKAMSDSSSDAENEEPDDDDESDEDDSPSVESDGPKDYVEMDVTIVPVPDEAKEDSVWEPSELILTSEKIKSLIDLEEKKVGTTHSIEVWNGTAFGPDEPGKYEGERRLKIIFEVNPGQPHAWLHYYNEPIGQFKLPVGTIDV